MTEMLKSLAAKLPSDPVWLSSPLIRARTTLERLLALRGVTDLEPCIEEALAEQDFGAWEGRTYEEIYRETGAAAWGTPAQLLPPDGESFLDLTARVGAAVERLSEANRGRAIVAVAHAGPIRVAIAQVLGLDPNQALGVAIDPLSLTRFDYVEAEGDGEPAWIAVCINRRSD